MPVLLEALLQISSMCLFHVRLLESYTPRYLTECSTFSISRLLMVNRIDDTNAMAVSYD